jgi:Ketopantoate reductase PanE/ApbA C terminal
MHRDLKKGLPAEADAIVGDLLRCGQQHEPKTPLLEAAFINLSVYQHEREHMTAVSHERAAKGQMRVYEEIQGRLAGITTAAGRYEYGGLPSNPIRFRDEALQFLPRSTAASFDRRQR